MLLRYFLYFLLGGSLVTLITYLGTQGRSLLAAFIAAVPSISALTLYFICRNSGVSSALSYAKGLLLLLPAWCLYIGLIIFALPKLGLSKTLPLSLLVYLLTAFGIKILLLKINL